MTYVTLIVYIVTLTCHYSKIYRLSHDSAPAKPFIPMNMAAVRCRRDDACVLERSPNFGYNTEKR